MDNIKYDTLVKFAAYSVIVFVLTMILYLMYIDFLSETFFNIKKFNLKEKFTDSDIEEKLKYINLIEEKSNTKLNKITNNNTKIEHLTNTIDPLIYDPNTPYILKRDLLNSDKQSPITDAKCSVGDKIVSDTTCIINSNKFYLRSSTNNNFMIKVLSDGKPSTESPHYTYNVTIDTITPSASLNTVRKTYFYFPSNTNIKLYENLPRKFNEINNFNTDNKIDNAIITYFNNYVNYNNFINKTSNPLLLNNTTLIDTYFSYVTNLLLLKNSTANTIFKYTSGYAFDINDIKTNIIFLYNEIIIDPKNTINVNLKIDDQTNIKFMYDTPINMNIYSMELNPNITISFSKLLLTFDPAMPTTISKTSIWALNYLKSIQADNNANDYIFNYNDTLYFPIVISLATPNTAEWENNSVNGVLTYFTSLFATSNLDINVLKIKDLSNPTSNITIDGLSFVTERLKKFISQLGNKDILNITNIFVIYDSDSKLFQSWIITNINDTNTGKLISIPLVAFTTTYNTFICDTGYYYNNKCLPKCPDGFNYDFGLVCLNSKIDNYLPGKSMCNFINTITPSPTDPILSGIKFGCDPNYFTYNKTFSQSDITSNLNLTNQKESFGNVNLYQKMNNNNIHLTF